MRSADIVVKHHAHETKACRNVVKRSVCVNESHAIATSLRKDSGPKPITRSARRGVQRTRPSPSELRR